MPYGRKYPARRRRYAVRRGRYRRRYQSRRRYTPRRFSGRTRQPLHNICRTLVGDPININQANTLAYSFQLADLPSYTEFQNLFDYYRINAVKITFMPPYNVQSMSDIAGAPGSMLPIVHSAPIYDDTGSPSGPSDLCQRSGYRRQILKRPLSFFVKPALLLSGDDNQFDVTFWKRWIKTSNPIVNYFGYLFWIENANIGSEVDCQVYVKYYMQFKGIK